MKKWKLVITIMRIYEIGSEEAYWLLDAKARHHKLLSTGQVIAPYQSL
jgi:hypothetical protein